MVCAASLVSDCWDDFGGRLKICAHKNTHPQIKQTNMITMAKQSIPTNLKNYAGIIEQVKETDVLCGSKNTALGKHKGNLLLSARVRHHLDDYESASTRQEKTFINRSIINYMRWIKSCLSKSYNVSIRILT